MAQKNDTEVKVEEVESALMDRLDIKGDLRIRDQEIQRDDNDNTYEQRYRVRFYLNYDITDNILFESSIVSGKGNPTSGNVNFSEGIGIENFKIDILDLAYKFDYSWLRAGKSKHYFYRPIKTQLIWDNDLTPEGLSYGYENGDSFTAGIWKVHRLENEAVSTGDIYMLVAQYTHQIKYDTTTFNMGGGFYYYDGVKGNSAPYEKGVLRNSVDSNKLYLHDYAIAEVFGEVQLNNVWGKPLKFAATLAYNTAISSHNCGYDLSMQLGDIKNNLDWKIGYTYRDIQRDAVFGAHNDSDFLAGGTDGRGHIVTAKMQINKNMDLAGHFQWAELYTDSETTDADYNRIMLDVIFYF